MEKRVKVQFAAQIKGVADKLRRARSANASTTTRQDDAFERSLEEVRGESRRRTLAATGWASEETACYSWMTCQQLLLSILQGVKISADERTKIATSLEEIEEADEVKMIVHFCRDELIPLAMKSLYPHNVAEPAGSSEQSAAHGRSTKLTRLWNQLYFSILPDAQSVLLPLERFDPSFDSRRVILTSFRNKVVLPLLPNLSPSELEMKQMLMILSVATQDDSDECKAFFTHCATRLAAFDSVPVARPLSSDAEFMAKEADEVLFEATGERASSSAATVEGRRHTLIPLLRLPSDGTHFFLFEDRV